MIQARVLLALTAAGAVVAAPGCGSPCQDLAERICNCDFAGTPRDTCISSIKNQLGNSNPSSADQSFCQSKLGTCPDPSNDSTICQRILTPQGKVDCGLAYPPDGGS
jgi:hypothetical protein